MTVGDERRWGEGDGVAAYRAEGKRKVKRRVKGESIKRGSDDKLVTAMTRWHMKGVKVEAIPNMPCIRCRDYRGVAFRVTLCRYLSPLSILHNLPPHLAPHTMLRSALRPITHGLASRGVVRSMASTTHAVPGLSIGGSEVHGFVGAIGNTPLIRLAKLSEETGCNILAKAEFMSPGGSIKDRAALFLVKDAEAKGTLKPGGTVVEGTAGNTGIGLAHVCRSKGYKCVIYMPDTQVSAASERANERSEE
jgi:hypothetical protein